MKGAEAEARAAQHLEGLGRVILHRNYRIRGGEIDLVSRDEAGLLIFTEVRHRSQAAYGTALESITVRKYALMRRAAQSYLLRELGREDVPCGLEVLCIDGDVQHGPLQLVRIE